MYYTIYKITNQIDGKIYIGSHKTKNLDDNYMGSGKYLNHAIEKYGIENFNKEILFVFETPEEMYAKEAELVNEEFIATENTYNLKVGGYGGWDYCNALLTNEKRSAIGKLGTVKGSKFTGKTHSIEHRQKLSEIIRKKLPFLGKKHSEHTKNIMSEKAKARLKDPTKNSQYGTIWITDGNVSKKIKNSDFIPPNWYRGRSKTSKQ